MEFEREPIQNFFQIIIVSSQILCKYINKWIKKTMFMNMGYFVGFEMESDFL